MRLGKLRIERAGIHFNVMWNGRGRVYPMVSPLDGQPCWTKRGYKRDRRAKG